jgi:hypothetical protein
VVTHVFPAGGRRGSLTRARLYGSGLGERGFVEQPINLAADLLFSHILRQFPTLKFALSEGGMGWVPYFLERVDYVYKQHHAWTNQDFGGKLPSEVWKEHVLNCFIDDKAGIQMRELVGVDTIMWECDYPHSDTTWPRAPEILFESFAGVSDEHINKITHENAMREFRLAFTRDRPREKCTVGALRAESPNIDLTPMKGKGGTKAHNEGKRIVKARDIVNQLAEAFVERS